MKRCFDVLFSIVALIIAAIPSGLLAIIIFVTSGTPIVYWGQRVGRDNRLFMMPKFRSMRQGAPTVSTECLRHPRFWVTPVGSFMRKFSLDEIPQLWSILKGDMSFVGPRPALVVEELLITERAKYRVNEVTPGLTGWAQVNGRDGLSVQEKVQFDVEYIKHRSFFFDLKILFKTLAIVVTGAGISH